MNPTPLQKQEAARHQRAWTTEATSVGTHQRAAEQWSRSPPAGNRPPAPRRAEGSPWRRGAARSRGAAGGAGGAGAAGAAGAAGGAGAAGAAPLAHRGVHPAAGEPMQRRGRGGRGGPVSVGQTEITGMLGPALACDVVLGHAPLPARPCPTNTHARARAHSYTRLKMS
ncbi:hypothetical protein EYF80_065324 [Liparis tanakae]|uniref:Uncharacterized protein n=1 Tax=Liparis tanakae TaxID=230148 RepID=A0A4Z2E7K5_9TELE|nr:hypothetical protein EYF80_065324 [Liparis tanakae]